MALLRLSHEIHEHIVQHLDLYSIKCLRLTCRELLSKTYGPRFRSFLANQITDLSLESLDDLAALVSYTPFLGVVKTIRVIIRCYDTSKVDDMLNAKVKRQQRQYTVGGITHTASTVACTEEDLAEARSDLEWLNEQIRYTARNESDPINGETVASLTAILTDLRDVLQAITVDAIVYQGQGQTVATDEVRRPICIWKRTGETYVVLMNAIMLSGVNLSSLKIVDNIKQCSIDTINLKPSLSSQSTAWEEFVFTSLKEFAISISTRTKMDLSTHRSARGHIPTFYRYPAEAPEVQDEANFTGLAYLLERMPNLESLDLHFCNTLRDVNWVYAALLDEEVSESLHFHNLSTLSLRGLPVTSKALTYLLKNHHQTLTSITLDHIFLTDCKPWEPIFDILAHLPQLSKLRLRSLNTHHPSHPSKAVHLALPGESEESVIQNWSETTGVYGARRLGWTLPCRDGTLLYRREFNSRQEIIENGLRFAPGPQTTAYGSHENHIFSEIRRTEFEV